MVQRRSAPGIDFDKNEWHSHSSAAERQGGRNLTHDLSDRGRNPRRRLPASSTRCLTNLIRSIRSWKRSLIAATCRSRMFEYRGHRSRFFRHGGDKLVCYGHQNSNSSFLLAATVADDSDVFPGIYQQRAAGQEDRHIGGAEQDRTRNVVRYTNPTEATAQHDRRTSAGADRQIGRDADPLHRLHPRRGDLPAAQHQLYRVFAYFVGDAAPMLAVCRPQSINLFARIGGDGLTIRTIEAPSSSTARLTGKGRK